MNLTAVLVIWTLVATSPSGPNETEKLFAWRTVGTFANAESCRNGAYDMGLMPPSFRCLEVQMQDKYALPKGKK